LKLSNFPYFFVPLRRSEPLQPLFSQASAKTIPVAVILPFLSNRWARGFSSFFLWNPSGRMVFQILLPSLSSLHQGSEALFQVMPFPLYRRRETNLPYFCGGAYNFSPWSKGNEHSFLSLLLQRCSLTPPLMAYLGDADGGLFPT